MKLRFIYIIIKVINIFLPDPLGLGQRLCGDDERSKQVLQTIEVVNGRIAMLATVGYVVQEYVTGEEQQFIFHNCVNDFI